MRKQSPPRRLSLTMILPMLSKLRRSSSRFELAVTNIYATHKFFDSASDVTLVSQIDLDAPFPSFTDGIPETSSPTACSESSEPQFLEDKTYRTSSPTPALPTRISTFDGSSLSKNVPLGSPRGYKRRRQSTQILKKTISLATNLAQNVASVPGMQIAGELVITIINKMDVCPALFYLAQSDDTSPWQQMHLNQEMANLLFTQIDAFFYVVSDYATQKPDDLTMGRFIEYVEFKGLCMCLMFCRQLRLIAEDENLVPRHKFWEFFNSDDKKAAINALTQRLNNAIQVLEVNSWLSTWMCVRLLLILLGQATSQNHCQVGSDEH
jgi:hypothetical protein